MVNDQINEPGPEVNKSRIKEKLIAFWDNAGTTILFTCGLIIFWELVIRIFDIKQYILPAPLVIVNQFIRRFRLIWSHTLVTGAETLVGFTISVMLGIPLSMMIAFSKFLRKTVYPAAVSLEMVPKIAFAPLFIVWFGFGFPPKMIIVFLVCFFPILLNGILAFTSLSHELRYFSQSTGANAFTTFMKIRLPAALPQLFVGLKGAATNATVGATISEWIGGDAGLGYYIQMTSGDLRMDIAFAAIIMLAALGLALFYLVVFVEGRMIPWHVSQRPQVQVIDE